MNAFQIPSGKAFWVGNLPPGKIDVGIVLGIVSPEEAIHKDLIKAGIRHPGNRLVQITLIDIGDLEGVIIIQGKVIVVAEAILGVVIDFFP